MKRTLLFLLLFCLLGAGAFYAYQWNAKKQIGSNISPDMDFAISDIDRVHRIFLADKSGKTVLLERNGNRWTYNKVHEARQTAVERLLETMQKVRVSYIPPESAEPTMVKSIAAEGIKVETYDKENKIIKVYYVGGVTGDETGTFMMMENADHPYVVHIPSMRGSVRVHYRLNPEEWYSRMVFEEKPETIQSVSVDYPQNKSESFKIEKTGDLTYTVSPFYNTTPTIKSEQRKGAAEAYLLIFEKLGAEAHETPNPEKDSIMAMVPFAIVTVKKIDGTEKSAKFWPADQVEQDGKLINIRYLTECSWGPLMLTQHHVFGPVFRAYPMFFNRK